MSAYSRDDVAAAIDWDAATVHVAELGDDLEFSVFAIPDLFPTWLWEQLSAEYPELADFERPDRHAQGDKAHVNDRHPEFASALSRSVAWSAVVESLKSQSFVNAMSRVCRPRLGFRPFWERLPWCLVANPVVGSGSRRLRVPSAVRYIGRTPIRIGIEFSFLVPGDRIPPHTDVPGKLLSLMLYFPTPEQYTLPLGTEFYAGAPTQKAWESWMPTADRENDFFARHDVVLQLPYEANTLFGFVKSDTSWHGLRQIPHGVGCRRALIVNIFRTLR